MLITILTKNNTYANMEVAWRNNKIKKRIEKIAQANPEARKRIGQLRDAPCFLDIPSSAHAHFLEGNLKNYFAVDFDYPARLICEPIGEVKMEGHQFIKETITTIEVVDLSKDYHSK
jgi:hypothetical protein